MLDLLIFIVMKTMTCLQTKLGLFLRLRNLAMFFGIILGMCLVILKI